MTVAELIEKLKAMPQDAKVLSDGCDCYGDANGVELLESGEIVVTRVVTR